MVANVDAANAQLPARSSCRSARIIRFPPCPSSLPASQRSVFWHHHFSARRLARFCCRRYTYYNAGPMPVAKGTLTRIKIERSEYMRNTTTGLLEKLLQTLDVEGFLKEIREFDAVTQRQCLLKALMELWTPRVVGLHGPKRAKDTMQRVREHLKL